MRGPDAADVSPAGYSGHGGRLRANRFRPDSRFRRAGIGFDGRGSCRQHLGGLARQHALELALELVLGLAGGRHHLLEAVEFEHVELVDLDIDIDVGLLGLEFLAHDRALQDLRGRDERGESRRLRAVAGAQRGAADVDGDRDVGLALEDVERQRIDQSAVHQHAAVARDGREQRGQRHAGGDRAAQVAGSRGRLCSWA